MSKQKQYLAGLISFAEWHKWFINNQCEKLIKGRIRQIQATLKRTKCPRKYAIHTDRLMSAREDLAAI